MENSIYEKFKALSEKKRMTAEDKAEIEDVAAQYGLSLNKNCPNCYRDAALQIALANRPDDPQTQGDYELYPEIDITIDSYKYGRVHVCPKNCNAANVALWLEMGVPKRFFKRLPDADNK